MESLFEKYLCGELSYKEESELFSWLGKSADNELLLRRYENSWEAAHLPTRQMKDEYSVLENAVNARHTGGRWRLVSSIAGVAAAVVAVAVMAYSRLSIETFTCTADPGTTENLTLPDGSRVNLNAGSTITYTSRFNRKMRNVNLDGEAFFDVVHNPHCPFVVNADECTITVLGTKFNVSAYQKDTDLQITLAEGSIRYTLNEACEVMEPGDKVCYDGKTISRTKVDPSEAGQWRRGVIGFENMTLDDFVNRLSREYGVNVTLEARGFARSTFSGSFTHQDSVPTILETVCEIFPLKMVAEGDNYSLIYTTR